MKASDVPKGLDPGVWPPPRLVGRIPANVSRADRYRLAVARVKFIGLLAQDRRLPSLFAATSKRLGLRPHRRGLSQQLKFRRSGYSTPAMPRFPRPRSPRRCSCSGPPPRGWRWPGAGNGELLVWTAGGRTLRLGPWA